LSSVSAPAGIEDDRKRHSEDGSETEGKDYDQDHVNVTSKERRNAAVAANSSTTPDVEEADGGGVFTMRPGALAVRGPAPTGSHSSDGDDDGPSPRVRPRGRSARDGSSAAGAGGTTPLLTEPIAAYAVPEFDTDTDDDENTRAAKALAEADKLELIRNQILSQAAEAVVVTPEEDVSLSSKRRKRVIVIGAILVLVVIVGVAVGVAVPLTTQQNSNAAPTPAPDVLASLSYRESQGEGGFAGAIFAEKRKGAFFGDQAATTTGSAGFINCQVKACTANGTDCVAGKYYEPGCCLGSTCPDATKCGRMCPKPPASCSLTDPENLTCTRSECYTCNPVNGQDMYELSDFIFKIDCLQVGTSVRSSNGQTYKWAIFCGPVQEGGQPNMNQDAGDYQCVAVRDGAGYSDDAEGILTDLLSCPTLALAECGCGPAGMNASGLAEPNGTCPVNGTCRFQCDDSGSQSGGAQALCTQFPGNLSWWDGANAFNHTLFVPSLAAPNYQLDIYIQGEPS
jgi:hypothetical protein